MEFGLPVASRPSTTLVTSVMSTTPRGLLDGFTSDSAKRNSQPSLSTNQRRRQVLMTSPCEYSQPVFSGDFQNSTSSQVGSCIQDTSEHESGSHINNDAGIALHDARMGPSFGPCPLSQGQLGPSRQHRKNRKLMRQCCPAGLPTSDQACESVPYQAVRTRADDQQVRTDARFLLPLPFSRADNASATSWSRSVDVSDVLSSSTILCTPPRRSNAHCKHSVTRCSEAGLTRHKGLGDSQVWGRRTACTTT